MTPVASPAAPAATALLLSDAAGGYSHPDPHAVPDDELIRRAALGDDAAFASLYGRYSDVAFRLAFRVVRTADRADDVVQESFLALWSRSHQYRPERGSVRTYLLTIVQHRAIDALRRDSTHQRRRAHDEGALERHEAPERTDAEAERHEEAAIIRRAIARLPGPQAKVIELAYFDGLSQSQIADRIDEPIGTVKGRVRLALVKLRIDIRAARPA